MKKIYLSYRREDSATVTGRIYDWLTQRIPTTDVYFDVDMEYGVDFVERIQDAIAQCNAFLVVIGPHWLDDHGMPSSYVRMEVEQALNAGILVIPVLVGNATMPQQEQLPLSLQRLSLLNAANVRDGRDFHRDMQDLAKSLGIGAAAPSRLRQSMPHTISRAPHKYRTTPRIRYLLMVPVSAAMVAVILVTVIGVQHVLLRNAAGSTCAQGKCSATSSPDVLLRSLTNHPPLIQDSLAAPSDSKWDIGKSEYFGTCEYRGLSYHVAIQTPGLGAECISNSAEYSDVAIQVDMKIGSGDAGGLILCYDKEHGTRLRFVAYQDGHYDFTVASGAGLSKILAKGTSEYLNSGLGRLNVLTVIDKNDTAFLYANGHFLQSVSLSSPGIPTYGFVGLVAFDYSLATDVAFTNERIWTV